MEMDMKIRMGLAITGWLVAGAMVVAQTPVNVGSSVVTMSLDGFVGGIPSGLNQALKGHVLSAGKNDYGAHAR
jgi:hypothetical protein